MVEIEETRQSYEKPEIIQELELETRAGSPYSPDPFSNQFE